MRASPRARRLARDRGIDLAALTGSGRNGRISGDDVLSAGATKDTAAASAIQVATIAGTIQVREWPAVGQRRGDAFLIHGLFADADSYTLLARRLAKGGLRVLAIDLPGHGGSDASATTLDQLVDTTATALRALAVGPVRLVGHSLGAMIAAKLAAEGEVALDHLLLLAPAGLGKEIDAGFIDGMIAADTIADLERETREARWRRAVAELSAPSCWRASSRAARCCATSPPRSTMPADNAIPSSPISSA